MVETIVCWHVQGNPPSRPSERWCETDFVHPPYVPDLARGHAGSKGCGANASATASFPPEKVLLVCFLGNCKICPVIESYLNQPEKIKIFSFQMEMEEKRPMPFGVPSASRSRPMGTSTQSFYPPNSSQALISVNVSDLSGDAAGDVGRGQGAWNNPNSTNKCVCVCVCLCADVALRNWVFEHSRFCQPSCKGLWFMGLSWLSRQNLGL